MPQLVERLAEARVRQAWPAVVGDDVARRTRPDDLVEGCLTVVVDNSPWLHELTLRQAEILRLIQRRWPAVRALRFRVGALPHEPREQSPATPSRPVVFVDGDRQTLAAATAAISDAGLANAVRRVLARAEGVSGARTVAS